MIEKLNKGQRERDGLRGQFGERRRKKWQFHFADLGHREPILCASTFRVGTNLNDD